MPHVAYYQILTKGFNLAGFANEQATLKFNPTDDIVLNDSPDSYPLLSYDLGPDADAENLQVDISIKPYNKPAQLINRWFMTGTTPRSVTVSLRSEWVSKGDNFVIIKASGNGNITVRTVVVHYQRHI